VISARASRSRRWPSSPALPASGLRGFRHRTRRVA
jgi:hypothetical protein